VTPSDTPYIGDPDMMHRRRDSLLPYTGDPRRSTPYTLVTPDVQHDCSTELYSAQHNGANRPKGILRKVWHNTMLHWPITSRSKGIPQCIYRQLAAQVDSLACSPTRLLRASPDNRLPRMVSLACSLTGPLCAAPDNWLPRLHSQPAAPPDYSAHLRNWFPSTLTPVAGCPHHVAPDQLAHCHMDPA
jgi:hypothetical protein